MSTVWVLGFKHITLGQSYSNKPRMIVRFQHFWRTRLELLFCSWWKHHKHRTLTRTPWFRVVYLLIYLKCSSLGTHLWDPWSYGETKNLARLQDSKFLVKIRTYQNYIQSPKLIFFRLPRSGSNMIKPGMFLWQLHATSPGCRLLSLAIPSYCPSYRWWIRIHRLTDHAAMMHWVHLSPYLHSFPSKRNRCTSPRRKAIDPTWRWKGYISLLGKLAW